ncbi:MAG: polymerase sigma-70 factor, subfamily [Micromonosporaceae bacterium]
MRPDRDGGYVPFGLVILDVADGQITGITTYLDVDRLLPLFRPMSFATPTRTTVDSYPGASS